MSAALRDALEQIRALALTAQRRLIAGEAKNGRGALRKIEETASDALRHDQEEAEHGG